MQLKSQHKGVNCSDHFFPLLRNRLEIQAFTTDDKHKIHIFNTCSCFDRQCQCPCSQCLVSNEYCRNPRRHSECGYLLCTCYSTKTDTCPYCDQRYSQSNTSPAYQVNTIIEAAKTIKSLISQKQLVTTDAKIVESISDIACTGANIETANIIANSLKNDNGDFKIPDNTRMPKKKKDLLDDPSSSSKTVSGRGTRTSGRQSKISQNKEGRSSGTNTAIKRQMKEVSMNIKTIMKRNTKGETKLHSACVKGDLKKVEEFLNAGADPCTKDNAGWTPLHEAVSKGHIGVVKVLLEAGAMVNVPGCYNNTPLHDAALNNHLEAARLLIAYGANPHLKNIEGYTPQSMAQTKEMEFILEEFNSAKTVPRNVKNRHHWQEIVLYGFNLPEKELKQLNTVANRFKLKQVSSYKSDVTHIIVSTSNKRCTPAMDILNGILKGRWIVDSSWLHSCLNSSAVMDPSEHEVIGTTRFPDSFAPKRSRENAEKMQPSIFNGCHFYFCGVDKITTGDLKFTKTQISSLIISGDGLVLTREPNPESIPAHECTVPYHANGSLSKCSHYIVYQPGRHEPLLKYNMPHVKSLPASWLIDCIETFTLIEP